ncbi:MAG: class I SAM-dependent methyltransferase family protein [Candidatus Bathyarchaeota archaeon]
MKLLNSQLAIKKEDDYVIIPLSRKPTDEEGEALGKLLQEAYVAKDKFEERKLRRTGTMRLALEGRLSPKLLGELPRSMDIIGRIAIIEVSPNLEGYERMLGKAILETNKNVKTVLAKAGAVSGEHRLREFRTIAGAEDTFTVYKEHGCVYALDPSKVYFSPRLSQERWRVAQKVQGGEVIIDMFAGVGPFSIQIAKKHSDVKIYSIDMNSIAIQFLKRNIAINKVENIFPILGDAREVVDSYLTGEADRVIMNLPERAIEFIDIACKALKLSGGIIHYYGFWYGSNALEEAGESLKNMVARAGRAVTMVLDTRCVRSIAPHEWQVAIDTLVS